MTLIIAFIVSHLSWFAIGGSVIGAFIAGHVHGTAKSATKVQAAEASAAIAQKQSAIDQGNAAASASGEQAVVNRAKADSEAQSTPRDEIDAQLAAIGAQRKE